MEREREREREREKERERERERGLFRSKEVRSQFSRVVGLRKLTPSSPHDKQLMDDIGHYAVYAMASYSILMLMYVKPCTGICGASCRACCCRNRSGVGVKDDNVCGLHQASVAQFLSNRKAELVLASFSNDVSAKPYVIIADHEKKTVVISIRGTLSLEDCITDIVAEPKEMTAEGERWGFQGEGRYAHDGMLRASQWIRQDLEQHAAVLQELVSTSPVSASTPLTQSYSLVIVGHSLGAGTATLLSLSLKKEYPTLRCFAFGCPGSVVDLQTSEEMKCYVTSLCLGNDMFCRLSVDGLNILREKVLDVIARAKVNKMVIMQALFKEYVHHMDDLLYTPGSEPDSDFRRSIQEYSVKIRNNLQNHHCTPLYIPGRVIHLAKIEDVQTCCSSEVVYIPVESSPSVLNEILISPTMLTDHLPDRYAYECERISTAWKSL